MGTITADNKMGYTPTEWDTTQEKDKFEKQFKAFVLSGFKRNKFPKWFYIRLSMCFGMIAHYDQNGFYETFFTTPEHKRDFIHACAMHRCYGDPAYTYSDVEQVIREWIINVNILNCERLYE